MNSAASPAPRDDRGPVSPGVPGAVEVASSDRRRDPLAAVAARRCAGCPGRMDAGGVGPLPSSLWRPWPPVPGRGLPDLVLPEPERPDRELPALLTASAPNAGLLGCPRPGCPARPGRP